MAYKKRKDTNQAAIEAVLKQLGIAYFDTSALGRGFPDLAVGYKGKNFLFEVKTAPDLPRARKLLTPAEQEFEAEWGGQYHVVTNFEEVWEVINE